MNTYIEQLKFISSFLKGSGNLFQFGDNQIRRYERGRQKIKFFFTHINSLKF